jgi:hypothetical protein
MISIPLCTDPKFPSITQLGFHNFFFPVGLVDLLPFKNLPKAPLRCKFCKAYCLKIPQKKKENESDNVKRQNPLKWRCCFCQAINKVPGFLHPAKNIEQELYDAHPELNHLFYEFNFPRVGTDLSTFGSCSSVMIFVIDENFTVGDYRVCSYVFVIIFFLLKSFFWKRFVMLLMKLRKARG